MIRVRSRSSRRTLPMKRSEMALARGACTGVLMMRTSMAVKTASNAAVNLASRSHEEPDVAPLQQGHQEARLPCGRAAMAFKLVEAAQARWRAVNAPHPGRPRPRGRHLR